MLTLLRIQGASGNFRPVFSERLSSMPTDFEPVGEYTVCFWVRSSFCTTSNDRGPCDVRNAEHVSFFRPLRQAACWIGDCGFDRPCRYCRDQRTRRRAVEGAGHCELPGDRWPPVRSRLHAGAGQGRRPRSRAGEMQSQRLAEGEGLHAGGAQRRQRQGQRRHRNLQERQAEGRRGGPRQCAAGRFRRAAAHHRRYRRGSGQ